MTDTRLVVPLAEMSRTDGAIVGGKNASLGEMMRHLEASGVRVPPGFATTSNAYWAFVDANGLRDVIKHHLDQLDNDLTNLADVGQTIRQAILGGTLPEDLVASIISRYRSLSATSGDGLRLAVRSSATAEDLPEASFAGQLESFLGLRNETELLDAIQRCFASLFTDRAISYRINNGFDHMAVALSVGVQRMVRSDLAGAGVAFTIDTETGFPRAILLTAAYGLGETVVQGMVEPDEYNIFKPLLSNPAVTPIVHKSRGQKLQKLICSAPNTAEATELVATSEDERRSFVLTDDEVLMLAHWAVAIEAHYGTAMDIEWAKDGVTGELFIVQARPETVQATHRAGAFRSYVLGDHGPSLVSGLAIGEAVATGPVCRLDTPDQIGDFESGAILVTGRTDPDWVPIMKRAAAIVTDHGGRTSHAAIVSRELGLPAIVGAEGATERLVEGQVVTVSCCEGDEGRVYNGAVESTVTDIDLSNLSDTRTKVMLNVANPAAAFHWWHLPSDGIGLARMEFIISNHIKVHPMALAHFDRVTEPDARAAIEEMTRDFPSMAAYFIDRLSRGIARIAAAHHPAPVIVRLSDFKTNEYASLLGGAPFEPHEDNPMIGYRGASRYYSDGYRDGFLLECRALRHVRETIGLDNVIAMVPFCRTIAEADRVLEVMSREGLSRRDGLEVYMMVEIPANVILADQFAQRFDGFSIGSNDLTQLILGIDRDSEVLSDLFDEENEAVKTAIASVIADAQRHGVHTGLCGQAPSDRPDFARFLVACGIDSLSVTPDSFIAVKEAVAAAEADRDAARPEGRT